VPDDCVVFIYHQSIPNRWLIFNYIVPAKAPQRQMTAAQAKFVAARLTPPGFIQPLSFQQWFMNGIIPKISARLRRPVLKMFS
jgi:hypothetical protein